MRYRKEQVHANAAVAGIELSEDVLAAVDGALGDVPQSAPRPATNAAEGVKHR